MNPFTRRIFIKTGVAAATASALPPRFTFAAETAAQPQLVLPTPAQVAWQDAQYRCFSGAMEWRTAILAVSESGLLAWLDAGPPSETGWKPILRFRADALKQRYWAGCRGRHHL